MPIRQGDLVQYGRATLLRKSASTFREARASATPTAFLSHSHRDAEIAKGVQGFLQEQGWTVYIDWEDEGMPPTPNRETAERIQQRIRQMDWFLFLATANSMASRWCPWEIGYADGVKGPDAILILPTRDDEGRRHGSEYLQLYRQVEEAQGGGFGVFEPSGSGRRLSAMSRP